MKACAGSTQLCFIEVKADESVIRERLGQQREFSDADFQVYMNVKSLWQPMNEPHLVLDSDQTNIDELLDHARQYCDLPE